MLMGSETEAINPSIAVPAYILEKSLDPLSSTKGSPKQKQRRLVYEPKKLKVSPMVQESSQRVLLLQET